MKHNPPFLLLILIFLSACAGRNQTENTHASNPTEPEHDTLQFSSGIRAIFQDSKGNYWFGSHAEGAAMFNGKEYRYFTAKDGLANNQVRSIQEDESRRIWFGTANGVYYYADGRIHNQALTPGGTWGMSGNDLWFNAGNNSPGVFRYHDDRMDYLPFPLTLNIKEHAGYQVTAIAKGKDRQIWIATYGGVFGYDGKDFTFYNDQILDNNQRSGFLHVRSILEDSKGRLWIGNNGIGVLLKEGDSVYNFSEKHKLIHLMSPRTGSKSMKGTMEHVFSIAEDAQGNMWFGDRDNGVWCYKGDSMVNYTVDPRLSKQMVWCIFRDKDNNMLFGLAEGGVYRFEENAFHRVF